ncbi:DNA polymerase III delta subunit [Winogradskyella psychrotolerans RS-3]|uniref:DNA polymerase III subunit delta n=1 Tax=Winogradskyella psychrotolerans RS-3 TaxID=641526 RepID=S7WVG0_9FLAO|nr:DNA polymerase III delta subunit [Winogradskyella psychrotolerans RS-3]
MKFLTWYFYNLDEIKEIVAAIKKGDIKPIYFLMGEEAYYIDKISDYIEEHLLDETEKGFNQMVLYGRDVSIDDIVSNAKRYPMMAERQVVIVKEAQDLSRTIEQLAKYAANPQPSTVLVLNYKYKKIDKRKALYKALKKDNVVFESKKMYENQVADWIRRVLAGQDYIISPKAAQMLVEFLGTDLSKIDNELKKLKIVLPAGTQITPEHIEENIGISKDYNNFELRKAVGSRNAVKAHQIAKYFAENPKDNPIVVSVALLFKFFSDLLHLHGMSDKNPRSVASALKVNPYFVNEYLDAARNYPMKKVSYIIGVLRETDVKSKGVGANAIPQGDLLKELLVKVLG